MKPVYFTGNIEKEGTYQYAHGPGQIISMDGVLLHDGEWYKGRMMHGKIFFTETGVLRYDGEFYPNGEFKKGKLALSENQILEKINERNKAREDKNYKLADKIRNELLDKGILIEDKDGKTIWKIK